MLDQLDDPTTPDFGGAFRIGVDARIDQRRRRVRAAGGVGALASIVVAGAALSQRTSGPEEVVDTATSVSSVTSPTSVSIDTNPASAPDAPPSIAPTTVIGVPLAGRTEALADDEWLLPTDLPDGFVHLEGHVQHEASEGTARVQGVTYIAYRAYAVGLRGASEQRGVRLEIQIFEPPPGFPPPTNPTADWTFDGNNATRSVGRTQVFVGVGPGEMSDDDFHSAVDSIAVVPRSALTATILDPIGPDTVELAAAEFDDERFVLAVQRRAFDETDCFFFGRWPPAGFSCIDPLAVDGVMSAAHNHRSGLVEGTSTQKIQAFGLVSDEVARVDVELMDGSTVRIVPLDEVDGYALRPWILATSVRVDTTVNPLTLGPAVVALTAFDADGRRLAQDRAD